MRMTNFRTGDRALTEHLVSCGFTLNRSMNGIAHDPSQIHEVMTHVQEFYARRNFRVRRRENRAASVIRTESELLSALTRS